MGRKKRRKTSQKQQTSNLEATEAKAPSEEKKSSKRTIVTLLRVVLFSMPLALGMYYSLSLRYEDVPLWQKKYWIVNGKGPLASTDAYLWLKYARDADEGIFKPGAPDKLRCYPDHAKYPERVPLISVLLEKVVKFYRSKGKSIDYQDVAFWLPPVLATVAAIPIFLYGLEAGGILVASAGAAFGVISLGFFHRTTIARYDTDGLNMFFIFMFPYLLLMAHKIFEKWQNSKSRKHLIYSMILSALAGLTAYLMAWWYGHEGFPLVFWLAFVVLLFFPEKDTSGKWKLNTRNWKEKLLLALIFLIFYTPHNVIKGIPDPIKFLRNYLFYPKTIEAGFPQVFQSISEIQKLSPKDVFKNVGMNSSFAGWIALLSFLTLFVMRFKKFLPISPLAAFALLIFFRGARRLVMFLAPFLGMGIGFLFEGLIYGLAYLMGEPEEISRSKIKRGHKPRIIPNKYIYNSFVLSLVALLVVAFVIPKSSVKKIHAVPVFNVPTYKAFTWLSKDHQGNHILTWWDYGYAIIFLGRTATYHDGGTFNSPRTYFVARFFTTDNYTEGINGILGVEKLGADGILKKIKNLDASWNENPQSDAFANPTEKVVKDLLSGKYNKYPDDDIIVLISEDMVPKFAWISYFGTWDFKSKKGKHLYISPLRGCYKSNNTLFCDRGRVKINLETGAVEGGRIASIGKYVMINKITGEKVERTFSENPEDLVVEEIVAPGLHRFYLLNEQSYSSALNRLFFLEKYPSELFEKIYDDFPHVVMYRLKRENLKKLGFLK